jgi:hypothetical protein
MPTPWWMVSPFGGFSSSYDPLTPYLGVSPFAPRSVTGPARGSPGGLPYQAREVSPFTLTRERTQRELEDKPWLQNELDRNTTAEVGTDPYSRRMYQAIVLDRAAQTGAPLADVINNPAYYPASTTSATRTTGQGVDESLWAGANPANYATGNASYDPRTGRWVGFAGGPQTASRGGEIYGIEGQAGLPYARAMGYRGPERTAIGPQGPQGADDTVALAGGAPTGVSAGGERRRMPTNSLMDLFRPAGGYYGPGGGQDPNLDIGGALAQRQNSLIGLGLGLMNQRPGTNTALSGFQTGAGLDADIAARNQSLAEQRAARAQAQQNWERQFARGGITEAQKAADDLGLRRGSPEHIDFMKQFYLPKTEQPSIVWQEDASGNKVPYRQDPRTGTVAPIALPGAQTAPANPYATGGKMTTDEGKTALFADRAATAHDMITKFENLNAQPGGTVGGLIQQNLPAGAANVLVSGERGQSMDAQRAFVNALLRRESGAAINAGEFTSYAKEYFPQLGDTPEQIENKRKHRAEVIAGLARESGKGYRPSYSFNEKGYIIRGQPTYAGKGGSGDTAAGQGGGDGDPHAEARAAIAAGASRDAVIKRMRERGIDPSGL